MSSFFVSVIGATGLVGQQVLAAWQRRELPADALRLYASPASQGEELELNGEDLPVEAVSDEALRGVTAAIFALPPALAQPWIDKARKQGVWAIDVSGALRSDPSAKLVVPGFNDGALFEGDGRQVFVPSPAAQALTLSLEPWRKAFGLVMADATVLSGAASAGKAGVERLTRQTAELLNAKEPQVDTFPHRLAFNVIPGDAQFEAGLSLAERAILVELARLWAGPTLPAATVTCLAVPTFHGQLLSVSAHLGQEVDAEALREAWRSSSALKVLDTPEEHVYPMPMLSTDDGAIHVGRLRAHRGRAQFVASVDNTFRAADAAVALVSKLVPKS